MESVPGKTVTSLPYTYEHLGYYPNRITSAAIESINGIIQTARRRARGFRNFENLKAICYWMAGDLNLKIPSAFTHPI